MKKGQTKVESIALFHNIRSALNVGAMLRTCDAVGIRTVYASSIVPGPLDRFGRLNPEIVKTALGAQKDVDFQRYDTLKVKVEALKHEGYLVVFVEQDAAAIDYRSFSHDYDNTKLAIVVGEETKGFTKEEVSLADVIVEIPMFGDKESLNVATSFGIVAYRLLHG